jgi:hypothetical protein
MNITAHTVEKFKHVSYRVEDVPDFGTAIYTDVYNENDRIVDSFIRTEDGYAIEAPALFETIQEFVGTYTPEL